MSDMVVTWSDTMSLRWIRLALQGVREWARLGSNQPTAETADAECGLESPQEQALPAAPYDWLSDSSRLSGATTVVTGWSETEPEGWPWRLRDQAVLTAEDHAEMLDLRERVLDAFEELGKACA